MMSRYSHLTRYIMGSKGGYPLNHEYLSCTLLFPAIDAAYIAEGLHEPLMIRLDV